MANSATMSTSNGYVKYRIECVENSTSIENNTSNVTIKVYFWRTNTGYQTYGPGACYCKINGTTYTATVTSSQKITNSGIYLFSKVMNIPHSSDGTKTLTCSAWIDIPTVLTSSEQSASFKLTDIKRASVIDSVTEIIVNGINAPLVSFTTYLDSCTHKIRFWVGANDGSKGHNSGLIDVPVGATTYSSYAIPLEWLDYNTDKSRYSLAVDLLTYSGDTLIGTNTYIFYVTNGEEANPTCSLATSKSGDNTLDCYINGKNGVTITVIAEGKYGATITRYDFYQGSSIVQSGVDSVCNISNLPTGDILLKVIVTDSRGATAESEKEITVYSYSPPAITSLVAYRTTSSSSTEQNNGGTYTYRKAIFTYSSCGGLNSLSSSILQYKPVTAGSTWITAVSDLTSNSESWGSNFDINNDYEFRVVLTDAFNTVYSTPTTVPGMFKLMSFNGAQGGVAFGQAAVEAGLVSNMDTTINKSLKVLGDTDVNNINAKSGYFSGGVTEQIPIYGTPDIPGDCNSITTSGRYYIGSSGANKPGSGPNGWLECLKYSTDYCYQRYVTHTGIKYERTMQGGTWGDWTLIPSFSDISTLVVYDTTVATWSPISANSVYDKTVTLTVKSGYKPIGIVSVMISGTQGTRTHPTLWNLDSDAGTVYFRLANTGTAATGTMTVTIGAIYMRTFT